MNFFSKPTEIKDAKYVLLGCRLYRVNKKKVELFKRGGEDLGRKKYCVLSREPQKQRMKAQRSYYHHRHRKLLHALRLSERRIEYGYLSFLMRKSTRASNLHGRRSYSSRTGLTLMGIGVRVSSPLGELSL